MEIVGCHTREKNLQVEWCRNGRLDKDLYIFGTLTQFTTRSKANLLSQTARDPQGQAITPILNLRVQARSNDFYLSIPAFGRRRSTSISLTLPSPGRKACSAKKTARRRRLR